MKKAIDNDERIIYKYSHSVSKGGNVYINKTVIGKHIDNKEGLRNVLVAISRKDDLVDVTIKIYDDVFFLFFHLPRSLALAMLIENIRKNIKDFADWDKEYVFAGVYDLQERYIREDLKRFGVDYDEG